MNSAEAEHLLWPLCRCDPPLDRDLWQQELCQRLALPPKAQIKPICGCSRLLSLEISPWRSAALGAPAPNWFM